MSAGSKSRDSGDRQRWAAEFVSLTERHMAELGWQQTDLAAASGLSKQQLWTFLTAKKRPPGPHDAGQVAAAMISEMAKRNLKAESRVFDFHPAEVMKEFMHCAGHRLADDFKEEATWERVKKTKELRVGVFSWGQFANLPDEEKPADGPGNFVGPSAMICQRICELLGVALKPVLVKIPDVDQKLANGEIDVSAPMILMPARLLEFSFTKPLPTVRVDLSLVASGGGSSGQSTLPDLRAVKWSDYALFVVKNGVADILLPAITKELVPQRRESWSEIATAMAEAPKKPTPALMADSVTCKALKDGFRVAAQQAYQLPIALGVHPQEQRLTQALNACIDLIAAEGINKYIAEPEILGFSTVK